MASQNQLQNHTLATQSAARVYAKLILYGFKTSNFVVACTGGFDIPVFGSKPLNDFREDVFNYVIVFLKVHEIFSLAFFYTRNVPFEIYSPVHMGIFNFEGIETRRSPLINLLRHIL